MPELKTSSQVFMPVEVNLVLGLVNMRDVQDDDKSEGANTVTTALTATNTWCEN